MFNSKSIIDSKIYIGKDKPIILENVNGILHITENNIRRPFIETFDSSINKLLTVSQNRPIISDASFDSNASSLNSKNINLNNLIITQTEAYVVNNTIRPISSNVIVQNDEPIKYIDMTCDTTVLFLNSKNTLSLEVGGNLQLHKNMKCDSTVCLLKNKNQWSICSYNTEIIVEKNVIKEVPTYVRKEIIVEVPKEVIVEKIVEVPKEVTITREKIIEKIVPKEVYIPVKKEVEVIIEKIVEVPKEVIITKEVIVEKIVEREVVIKKLEFDKINTKHMKKVTLVIAPLLNSKNKELYDREISALNRLDLDVYRVLLLVTGDIEFDNPNMRMIRLPSSNERGLLKLKTIIENGLVNSDAMIYINSDCTLSSDYYNRINNISDIDFIMRNNIDETGSYDLYRIGIDGFYMTREYYENVMKDYDLNMYVGEPYWDVTLYNLVKKINQSVGIDCFHMTHHSHIQTWDCSNLSTIGKYNKILYDFYNTQYALPTTIELKTTLSVIIVFYGKDESRMKGLYETICRLHHQRREFELVIVEANFKPIFDTSICFKNHLFKYRFVEMHQDNIGLWQKEALMNIGVEVASNENLLFLDSDVYCQDSNWLSDIDNALTNNDIYLQPFKSCQGSLFKKIGFYSRAYVDSGGSIPNINWLHNPGLCVAIRKSTLQANGGVNPFYLYGCGDSGMYYEMTTHNGDNFYKTNKILSDARRQNLPRKLNSVWLDYHLTHIDHGVFNTSFYSDSISTYLSDSIKTLICLDKNKLVRWKRKNDTAESFVINKYNIDDIHLKCPHGRLGNKLILLMSVYQHLGRKHKIYFPELSIYSHNFPILKKFINCSSSKKTIVTYNDLSIDNVDKHMINEETLEFLTLSNDLQNKLKNINLNFENSIGIAIRQGDFKYFKNGDWYVSPDKYFGPDIFSYDNIYLFSDQKLNININIGVNVSDTFTNFCPELDLMLLSKCTKIVRNSHSSYGWLAASIGKYNKTLKDERLVG